MLTCFLLLSLFFSLFPDFSQLLSFTDAVAVVQNVLVVEVGPIHKYIYCTCCNLENFVLEISIIRLLHVYVDLIFEAVELSEDFLLDIFFYLGKAVRIELVGHFRKITV